MPQSSLSAWYGFRVIDSKTQFDVFVSLSLKPPMWLIKTDRHCYRMTYHHPAQWEYITATDLLSDFAHFNKLEPDLFEIPALVYHLQSRIAADADLYYHHTVHMELTRQLAFFPAVIDVEFVRLTVLKQFELEQNA